MEWLKEFLIAMFWGVNLLIGIKLLIASFYEKKVEYFIFGIVWFSISIVVLFDVKMSILMWLISIFAFFIYDYKRVGKLFN